MSPSRRARLGVALTVGLLAGWYRWHLGETTAMANDLGPAWFGARVLLAGGDPYTAVGPHAAFPSPWPLVYPLPALLALLPLAGLSVTGAAAVAAGLGAAALAYVLSRARWGPLAGLLGAGPWTAVQLAQWAPLVTAAALLPGAGWLLAAKPTIGAALFVAYPRRRTAWACGAVLALSLVLAPDWPLAWWANTRTLTHLRAPVTVLPFGPLLGLALLRWRQPEGRLLVALACVPTTMSVYETTPLLLIPATAPEALVLAVLSHVAYAGVRGSWDYATYDAFVGASAARLVPLVYLPALALVFRHPAPVRTDYPMTLAHEVGRRA